jgi:hypothetical protein
MKIDYVVIASDQNPTYKEFYPIIAKRWFEMGFKTYYVNIGEEDEIFETKWGIVHNIKSLDFLSAGLQSQIVRLFVCKFIDANLLLSDIDMLPLNKEYFNSYVNELTDENIIVYSGQPYKDVPYYPICYILSNSKTMKRYLEIEDVDFEQFCKNLVEKYENSWNTDERFLYDQLQKNKENIIIKKRDFSSRIDRSRWIYNEDLLSKKFYIDSHLLRPYDKYFQEINKLINLTK